MLTKKYLHEQLLRLGLFFILVLSITGCTFQMVADYDSVAFEEILRVGKKVDKFYGDLLELKPSERAYQKFSNQYVEIETDIRSIVTRNKLRVLNQESVEIAETTLKLWLKYKDNHQAKDAYADGMAKLDRNRFIRLFAAAADAERAKNLDTDDKDSTKDSK